MLATLAMYCAGLVGSCGSGSFTTGLGFRSHPLDSCKRFSSSRTLVKYWSRRARSAAPTLRSRSADLVGYGIENGPAGIEFRDLGFDLFGAALNEHLAEHAGGALFRRDGDAVTGPGEGARPGVDGQGQRGKARLIADAFGDVLVERDGVAERTAGRVRGCRQEADVGRMAAIHVGMRDAGEDGEVLAVILQDLEVVRGSVAGAGVCREELIRAEGRGCCRWRTCGAARRRTARGRWRGPSRSEAAAPARRRRRAASCGGRWRDGRRTVGCVQHFGSPGHLFRKRSLCTIP